MPGSPITVTIRPRPSRAAAYARRSVPRSSSRPTVRRSTMRGTALKRRLRVARSECRKRLLDLARRGSQNRILRDHAVHELLEPGRHRRVQPRQRHGVFQQDRGEHRRHRRRHPRPAPGEHLVERDAEREDIRRRPRGSATGLLGRHVGHRADQRERIRLRARVRFGGGPGLVDASQPEVQHLRIAVAANHHVLGLDVAMDDAGRVGGRKRLRDLPADVDHRRRRVLSLHASRAASRRR